MINYLKRKLKAAKEAIQVFFYRIDHNQGLLTANLNKFLLLENNDRNATLDVRNAISTGCCYALSVLNPMMRLLGKESHLKWKKALVEINNWDRTAGSLTTKEIEFPGYDKPISLKFAMTLTVNYITQIQRKVKSFTANDYAFNDQFIPANKDFGIYFSKAPEKIKNTAFHTRMAGQFTQTEFAKLLDQQLAEKTIFVICGKFNYHHAVNLSYCSNENVWMVSDPNYKMSDVKKMEKKFATKQAAVAEIYSCFKTGIFTDKSKALTIEISGLNANDESKLDAYESLIDSAPLSLIRGKGLYFISEDKPEILHRVLGHKSISLPSSMPVVLKALAARGATGNVIDNIILKHPDLLHDLLKLPLFQNSKVKKMMAKTLLAKNEDGTMPLLNYALNYPRLFSELINKIGITAKAFHASLGYVVSGCSDSRRIFKRLGIDDQPQAKLIPIKHITPIVENSISEQKSEAPGNSTHRTFSVR